MILATHSLFETFPFQEFLVLRELVSTKCRSSNERFLNFISSKTWRWISTQNAYKQGNGLWLRGKCLYRCVLEWGLWQQREGLKQLHLSHSLHQSGIQAQLSWVLRRRQWHPHSSTLAWKIPWTEEPVRLQSMGSLRVGHDWATSLSLFTFIHWRRKWQPTPVFLPGESQGQGSLVGCCLWSRTESDMTEAT